MRHLFLTSRNRRRAARIRVSRCLGAEIRQAGRHVRAGGGERRGGLKLIPVSSHDTPYNPSRSNVRVSLNVEKKNSEKQGKKERNETREEGKGKVSFALFDRQRGFSLSFTRAHMFPGYTHIFERCDIYICVR